MTLEQTADSASRPARDRGGSAPQSFRPHRLGEPVVADEQLVSPDTRERDGQSRISHGARYEPRVDAVHAWLVVRRERAVEIREEVRRAKLDVAVLCVRGVR